MDKEIQTFCTSLSRVPLETGAKLEKIAKQSDMHWKLCAM